MPILFWLFVGHAVCDFPFQGSFLATGKNHRAPFPEYHWSWILFSHALIHAGMVAFVTGSFYLAMLELVLHMFIDFLKSNGNTCFRTDQILHYLCKVLYVVLMYFSLV
jgi:hypothetical protein